jgi:hypothetical protein
MAEKDLPTRGPDRDAAAETDERFPSGPWTGFWLQRSINGRQWMTGLWLKFANGKVEGGGSDWVGDFTFSGAYELEGGTCRLVKQYVGEHVVNYEGHNDGDGQWLWGVWTMTFDRGGFHMWPAGEQDPTMRKLEAEKEIEEEAVLQGQR